MQRRITLPGFVAFAVALSAIATGCSNEPSANGTKVAAEDKQPVAPQAGASDAPEAANSASSMDASGPDSGQDEPPPAKTPAQIRYSCENGKTVIAEYVESGAMQQVANLDIGGKLIGLSESRSASAARYETDEGLTPGKTLVWWTKGDSAMLIESVPGDADGASETVVNCNQVSG